MPQKSRTAVVAVGGHSLISDQQHRNIPDQSRAASETSRHIADMIEAGWNIVITHGNGPQVGFILRRSEIAIGEVPPVPMDYATSDTQGAIGWMFQRALRNEMRARGIDRAPIAVATQVTVDRDDPGFERPSKPIGSPMDHATAKRHAREQGWKIREDSLGIWTRVVASPNPIEIIDIDAIAHLVESGYIVIACGGGIPVFVDDDGDLRGIEAVVDKDLASSLLARQLRADLLLISTAVEKVALNFGKPDERALDRMTISEAREHLADGQFPEGSMGPKVKAIIAYLDAGGTASLITDPPNIGRAIAGKTGTHIVQDG